MTVLIVDDDPDSLDLINRHVRQSGYETVTSESGTETLELLQHITPEAIVLDAVMPECNGLDVMREIRRKKKTRNIPVIMVSALGPGIKLMLDDKCQANYYLSKPFSGKELTLVLNRLTSVEEELECWVNFNKIRKEAKVHVEGCMHLTKEKISKAPNNWKNFPSIETARYESEEDGFTFKYCKVCSPIDGEENSELPSNGHHEQVYRESK